MKISKNTLFWLIFVLLLPSAASVYASAPCLYIDRTTFWSGSNTPKSQGTVYTTPLTWRSVLPGLYTSAVTPYAYRIRDAYKALSYEAELQSMTPSGGQLALSLYGSLGQLTTISFTVMVVTFANPYLEMLITDVGVAPQGDMQQTSNFVVTPTITLSSSYRVVVYCQWLKLYSSLISNFNVKWIVSRSGGDFVINLWRSLPNYVERVKFVVVVLQHQNTAPNIALYHAFSGAGQYGAIFNPNMGVPSIYGSPVTQYNCILGIQHPDLNPTQDPTIWDLFYSGSSISGIFHSGNHYQSFFLIICMVQCPLSTYTQASTTSCLPCSAVLPLCTECISASVCLACQPGISYLEGGRCFYCNQSISNCIQCLNKTVCTQCQTTSILMPDGSACPFCSSYMPNCINCPFLYSCTMCSDTYFLGPDNVTCLLCADHIEGCYTCFSSVFCTKCDNLTLFISPDKTQCLICQDHIPSCLTCDSALLCFSCVSQEFYLSSNSSQCLPCSQAMTDCITCLSSTVCLTCQNSTVLSLHSKCHTCDSLMPNCLTCTSASYCDQCRLFTVPAADRRSCLYCRQFMQYCDVCTSRFSCSLCLLGISVQGGCTMDQNCLAVVQTIQNDTLTANCILCDANLILNSQGQCVCREGELMVGYFCTPVVGCVTTEKVAGVVRCTFCDARRFFLFNQTSNDCYCLSGHQVVNSICTDICGDGRVFTVACDDGNNQDGDGCSAKCQVELDHRCQNNGTGQISLCRYIGYNLNGSLKGTIKNGMENKGIFTFELVPDQPHLNKFNISEYFKFQCPEVDLGGVSWSYASGSVTAEVEYLTDMEGRQCTATFAFHQLYIPFPPVQITFNAISSTAALLFFEPTPITYVLPYIYLAVSIASLLVLFIGSWAHKMVGVELIHTLQLVYYLHYVFKVYTPNIGSLQCLSLVAMDHLFWSQEQSIRFIEEYQLVAFDSDYSERNLIVYMVVASIILVVWLIIFFKYKLESKRKVVIPDLKPTQAVPRLYNSLVFPLIIGFMMTFFFLRATVFYESTSSFLSLPLEPLSFFSTLAYFVTASVFFGELRHFHVKFDQKTQWKKFTLAHQTYIPVYQFFLFLTILVLQLGMVMSQKWFIYALAAIVLTGLILQLWLRPYYCSFDNISIIINSLTLVVYLGLLLAREHGKLEINQTNQTAISGLTAALCLLCVLCSGIRIVVTICMARWKQIEAKAKEEERKKKKEKTAAKKKKVELTKEQMTLKTMIESYAENNASKKVVLDECGKFNERRYPNARANNLKEDEERKALIAKMREAFGKKKMQHEKQMIREELEY